MGFNPPWQPMIHRRQLDLGGLERAKTPFDNQETFIAGGGVFQGNGVIVGDQHPFTVIPGSLLHGLAVEPNTVRVLVDFQITLIAAGGQQIDGPAGRGFGLRVSLQFRLQFLDHLLAVLPLPFGFQGIVAEDVTSAPFAIADDHFFGL